MGWLDASSLRLKPGLLGLLLGCCISASAQLQTPPPPTIPRTPGGSTQSPSASDDNDQDTMAHRAMIQQAQRRNDQRQKDIVADTDKLLTLTEQLKAAMEKSNSKDPMSVATIKKAEEIEKLAKSVKEKMKGN